MRESEYLKNLSKPARKLYRALVRLRRERKRSWLPLEGPGPLEIGEWIGQKLNMEAETVCVLLEELHSGGFIQTSPVMCGAPHHGPDACPVILEVI